VPTLPATYVPYDASNHSGNASNYFVCFQQYTNNSCMEPTGPKMCTEQGRCTHIETREGDESTVTACHAGYVTLDIYLNSSSCNAKKYGYTMDKSLSGCVNIGHSWGYMSCGGCDIDVFSCSFSIYISLFLSFLSFFLTFFLSVPNIIHLYD
jgi:hypothetical protein